MTAFGVGGQRLRGTDSELGMYSSWYVFFNSLNWVSTLHFSMNWICIYPFN